jgi:mono/diheme cytochrome c family protein
MRNRNSMIVSASVGLVLLWVLSGCAAPQAAPVPPTATVQVARPSNPGGPGPAATMTGDAENGEQIFAANCVACHGAQGKGGVNNPGSKDGTVPPLNPIDDTIKNPDPKVFAYNVDLFIEHGSTPDGSNPTLKMLAWGDQKTLTPQQISDVIAYVISLNK